MIDLHVHSSYSDGTLSPKELADCAIKKGLKAIALTDHDTVDGIDEILEYVKRLPEGKRLEVIPGIEYSTEYEGRDVHIVGLFLDTDAQMEYAGVHPAQGYKSPEFIAYLEKFKQSRIERNCKLCDNLQKAGIDITYEALLGEFGSAVITRAHYAGFLLDKGYVKSINEAFDRYLGDDTPYFVPREKITPEEVIGVTRCAGGVPILAHPTLYKLGKEQLDLLVKRLKAAGLMGIEVFYGTCSAAEEREMKALAKKYRLLQSGGSDFHGARKNDIDIGTGRGRLYIDDGILDKMKKAINAKILFTDLDGTLLTTDKKVSKELRKKLIDMIKGGHSLALASGRPINSILEVLSWLDIKDEVIKLKEKDSGTGGIYATAYNGAVLYDCIEDKPIEEYYVPMWVAQKLFDMAEELGMHIQTYADDHIVSNVDDDAIKYYTQFIHMPYTVGRDLSKELSHDPFKALAIDLEGREKLEKLREDIEAYDSKLADYITCAYSNKSYLEFYNKKAGKGNALINMCKALNILEKNSIAAGDEENDISMIEAAGTGVAMANANPIVKARADYVTERDNDHDGMIEVIEKFLK